MLRPRPAATTALATAALLLPSIGHSIAQTSATADPDDPMYVPDEPLPTEPTPPQEALDAYGINGYPDRLNVKQGESVRFMVSTRAERYTATMVRIQHGDPDPRGPGVVEQELDADVNGTYPGQYQPLPLGSYATVSDDPALNGAGGFTVSAFIAPSTIPGSEYSRTALQRSPVGTPRSQGVITKWVEEGERGYGLVIDKHGAVALRLGFGGQSTTVSTGQKLLPWAASMGGPEAHFGGNTRPMHAGNSGWYFVAASYDPGTDQVTVTQRPLAAPPNHTGATVTEQVPDRQLQDSGAELLMAAFHDRRVEDHPAGFYNGKIEDPQFYDRALDSGELQQLAAGKALDATATWDFSQRMSTSRLIDTGPEQLHGSLVNMPVRAVTGHDWDRATMNFNEDPSQWDAVHFHEDDMSDAGYRPTFTWKVPEDAPSGIYAARLQAGDDIWHATFVVTPDEPQHEVAMLVPTFSYLAYAKTGGTLSQYSDHADGSGYVYSSARRPIDDLRPYYTGHDGAGRPWQFEADTHIFHWLETKGYGVDYITDHDLHTQGRELLDDYDVLITGSHPEYISGAEMDAFAGWLEDGGRMMYLGGNGFYWVTALDDTGTFTELRRHDGTEAWQTAPGEYYHSTTGEYGGLWRFRGRPPQELVGVGFTAQGFGYKGGSAQYNRPFDRTEASYDPAASWIFDEVSREDGIGGDMPTLQAPGGPMGEEVDRVDYALGTPANAIVVGVSQPFGDEYMHVVEEINTSSLFEGGSDNPMVRGDITLMRYPNHGAVFSAASMVWSGGFYANGYDNDMTTITENVLDEFMDDGPLPGTG